MNVTFEDLLGPSEVVCCSGEGLNDRSRDSGGVATKAVLASEVQLISCFVARHFAQFSREKVEGWEGVTLEGCPVHFQDICVQCFWVRVPPFLFTGANAVVFSILRQSCETGSSKLMCWVPLRADQRQFVRCP